MLRRFATSNSQHCRIVTLSLLMIRNTFKLVMDFNAFTPLMVCDADGCNSSILVMGSVLFDFMFFQAFGDDYFKRFPFGISCTDNKEMHQLGMKASDKFSFVGTLGTFKRPSFPACCSHKKRTSTCRVFPDPCRPDMPLAALLWRRMWISHSSS